MTAKKQNIRRKRSRPIEPKKNAPNKKIIGILVIIIIIIIVFAVYIYVSNNSNDNETILKNPIANIDTSMGTIKLELYQDKVPNTCENFINYANEGFYNGLVFHRVIDNFVIQGGGFYPNGTKKETNDPINLEIHDDLRHIDGAISMARTTDPNSATSQFYICDGPQSGLDDNYAVFGIVIEGIEIVHDISSVTTTTKNGMQNWPVTDVIINSIAIEK
jgi:cyclophilin family peptidyl-prolyl cis-trans isomerase